MDYLVAILLAVFFALFSFRRSFRPTNRPPQTNFKCSRCGRVTAHTDRTIDASNAGKTKLFCGRCHGHWLQSQAFKPNGTVSSRKNSGCLGAVVLMAAVPAGGLIGRALLSWLFGNGG
jgi:hypothetical protein